MHADHLLLQRANTHPIELPDHLPESFEEQLAIFVILENIFAAVTACGDVIEGVGEFDSEGFKRTPLTARS